MAIGKLAIESVTKAGGKALDLTKQARLKRAAEQGFDTSKTLYHGTRENIDYGGLDAGSYLSPVPEYASRYAKGGSGGNVIPAHITEKGIIDTRKSLGKKWWDEYSYINQDDIIKHDSGLPDHNDEGKFTSWLIDEKGFTPAGVWVDENLGGALRESGASEAIKMYDTSGVRSVNAAFDPDKKGINDLLASAAPLATGLGIGALATGSNDTMAAAPGPLGMLAPSAQQIFDQYGSQDYGTIEGAVNPRMGRLADFIGDNVTTVLDPLTGAPLEGVEDWARKAAYGRTRWRDRAAAALDLMP